MQDAAVTTHDGPTSEPPHSTAGPRAPFQVCFSVVLGARDARAIVSSDCALQVVPRFRVSDWECGV